MMPKLLVTTSLLFYLIACNQHPYNKLIIGRWKTYDPLAEYPHPITWKFTKNQFIITDTSNGKADTANYTLQNNKIVFDIVELSKVDTIVIKRVTKDTISIMFPRFRNDPFYLIKD